MQKGKVSVRSIDDFTTDKVEIELHLSRGADGGGGHRPALRPHRLRGLVNSNIVVIRDDRPVEITVSEYLKEFTGILKKQIKAELEHELERLENRRHWLTLEQIFIENRVYKRIEKAATEEASSKTVYEGMKPFKKLFVRAHDGRGRHAAAGPEDPPHLRLRHREEPRGDRRHRAHQAVQREAQEPHQDHHRRSSRGSSRSTASTTRGARRSRPSTPWTRRPWRRRTSGSATTGTRASSAPPCAARSS